MTVSTIQLRRDIDTNWANNNPVLSAGEVGLDTTNRIFKVGDGVTAWNTLGSWAAWGNAKVTVGTSEPSSPQVGDVWVYYNSGG